MSEKKPESEPKKKSILDELRNFQIASLAIQHQAGIHEPLKIYILLWLEIFNISRQDELVVESLISGKIRRFHQRKSSVWRSIDSMSSGKAK